MESNTSIIDFCCNREPLKTDNWYPWQLDDNAHWSLIMLSYRVAPDDHVTKAEGQLASICEAIIVLMMLWAYSLTTVKLCKLL